jgi:triacylglycerol esterase/lipase EstA (alpha/beta hydrolase family)
LPSVARVASVRGLMLSVLVIVFVSILGAFHCATYLLWHYERCRAGACGGRLVGADLGSWIAEGLAIAAVVVTWPFGITRWSRPQSVMERPVLLVAGWGLNGASMALIAARLRRDGRAVRAATIARRSGDLRAAAESLADQIRDVAVTSGAARVDVVAYGLGGVLLRVAARLDDVGTSLGNVVTIASPHRGTALACIGPSMPLGELRPGSPFVVDLVRGEKLPTQTQVAAIASPFDAIVFPFDLAYWPGAFNVTVEGLGHFSMLYSERVYTLIAENLGLPSKKVVA